MSVVTDVQDYLVAEGVVDGSTGWPSVRGVLHDQSDRLVAIKNDGGALPEIGAASGLGSAAHRDPRVLITVRGAPHERDLSESKAQEIYDKLHGRLATTMGSGTYQRVMAETPPIEVGQDDNKRPIQTIAFRLAVAQGAPA